MIVVLSTDPAIAVAAVAGLTDVGIASVVAARSVGLALAIAKDNDVTAIVVHEPSTSNPFSKAIARRLPRLECIRIAWPIDIQGLRQRIDAIASARHGGDDSVVAHGMDELLGLLAMTQRSASIEVNAGLEHGTLAVAQGCIVHARMGHATGLEVALRLLGLDTPRIRSSPLVDEERTMQTPISVAQHEAARRRDELLSLARSAELAALLTPLCDSAGDAGVLFADADNNTALAQRGPGHESSTRRLWHAVAQCRGELGGVAWWDAGGVVVAAPVGVGRVLAAGTAATAHFAPHRRLLIDSAHAIAQLVERIHAGVEGAHARACDPWA